MSPWQHPQRWEVRAAAGGLGCGGLASSCPVPWSWWAWHLPCAKCWTAVSHGGCADPAEDNGNVKPACPREKQHRPGTGCGRVEMTRYSACQGAIHVLATCCTALVLTPVNSNYPPHLQLTRTLQHASNPLHDTLRSLNTPLLQPPLPIKCTEFARAACKPITAFARVLATISNQAAAPTPVRPSQQGPLSKGTHFSAI